MVHSIHQEDLIVFLKDAKEDYLKYSKRKLKGANLESIVKDQIIAVSYTHLTLPTIYSV